jgi:hypothetical protein
MTITARLKRALRALLEPVVRRLTLDLRARIAALEAGWKENVPSFLAAISTVGALGHELFGLRRDLEQQIATLREEFAALSRKLDGGAARPAAVTPQIVAPEKIASAKASGLKLDLDGGRHPRAGFVTVDREARDGVDVIAEPGDLPFEPASVVIIDAGRLLDRVSEEELRRRLLPFWLSLLAPGGSFRAVVRDASAAIAALAAGTCSFEEFRVGLLEQRPDGSYRGNLFTPEGLSRLLSEAGFVNVSTAPLAGSGEAHALFEIAAERASH